MLDTNFTSIDADSFASYDLPCYILSTTMYGITVHKYGLVMNSISVNQFRDNLKKYVEQTVNEHEPIKVTRRAGEDFIVMSADDWERDQETLHVLQSSTLMQQIAESMNTHESNKGYKPTQEQLDEITNI